MNSAAALKANSLPLLPGVYIMKDRSGTVIYVGKAKKLKNRVTSYFHGEHLPKVQAMVNRIDDFDYIIVNSELEAFVLENSLIKKYKPFYNILLKDDKGYPFIKIDIKAKYPTISMVRNSGKDGSLYFGPFGARHVTREIITLVSEALSLPDCSRKLPQDIGKNRPCLNYHIGKCEGWCMPQMSEEEYSSRIEQAVRILRGHSSELITEFEEQMQTEADEMRFENAARIRDRIVALRALNEKQRVLSVNSSSTDAIGFARGAKCCLTVLKYSGGSLAGKDIEILPEPMEEDSEVLADILRQYYTRAGISVPDTILTCCEIDFSDELESVLSQYSGHTVKVIYPRKGDRLKLVETASLNSSEEVLRITSESQRRSRVLDLLSAALKLERPPERIEAFDISNLGNTGIVAGMTVFLNGAKAPSEYRKFRLDELAEQNDFMSVYITLCRRFAAMKRSEAAFSKMPDLLLIDGGTEQLAFAKKACSEYDISVPVFGMVKDDRHRTRALVDPSGNEISISSNAALFAFIGTIQEETHRFSVEYQRSLRLKGYASSLDGIAGIGEKRKNALISHFGTLKAVKNASVDELAKVVPLSAAKSVYSYFHREGE